MSKLTEKLKEATANLVYMSETDSTAVVFSTRRTFEFLQVDNFFRRLAEQEAGWKKVKELMEVELDDLKVQKITNGVNVVYEVTGIDASKKRVGFRLEAVET